MPLAARTRGRSIAGPGAERSNITWNTDSSPVGSRPIPCAIIHIQPALWVATACAPTNPDIRKAMTKNARITGKVEYREGDGPNITIPSGPCQVDETALDATISWNDGDSHGSACIPLANYRSYLASKAIQVDGVQAT